MGNNTLERVSFHVRNALLKEDFRIIRVIGKAGSAPILREAFACPLFQQSSISIENIYFDSEHGLLGWVSNALGLYEGVVATRGKIPAHLIEIIRLRGVKYLVFDDFHESLYMPGVSRSKMAKDINAILSSCAGLRVILSQILDGGDLEFTNLLEYPACDIYT